jgi:hypothetical protein
MTRKDYEERRSALSKEIREAMRKRQAADDGGDRAGDLEAQGEISDLMAQIDELDRQFHAN